MKTGKQKILYYPKELYYDRNELYLAQFEISPRRAMEVFRTFGPGAMQAIAANPYLLCGEPLQLDFRHADSIAQYYHMEGQDGMIRISST